ncbi:hypothetical protein [Ralstonia sp. GP101]|uniref:hypothetical protein n=1 Tax=unclassified Ralstonia TaxID=209769 RepID=UPI00389176D5
MTTGALPCNVCQQPLPEPIYRAPQSALSSLRRAMDGTLEVFCCAACGHIQTVELCDNGSFYDTEYDILVNSEEEDQIYAVENGQKIFRADHQVALFQKKLQLLGGYTRAPAWSTSAAQKARPCDCSNSSART